MSKVKVMFVCLGNICRSPLAHAIFERDVKNAGLSDQILIESSGTGSWHVGHLPDPRMRKEAASHGVEMTHKARHFIAQDLENYDLIFAMDKQNRIDILSLDKEGKHADKVVLFREFQPGAEKGAEVPDPYYGDAEGFTNVYHMVEETSAKVLEYIKENFLNK